MSVSMSMSIALQAREPEVPPLRRRFRFGCGRDGNLHTWYNHYLSVTYPGYHTFQIGCLWDIDQNWVVFGLSSNFN